MADARVGLLTDLARRDEEIGAELAELDELAGEVDEIQERALELDAFFGRLPGEQEAAAAAIVEAENEVVGAREAQARAQEVLAAAEKVDDAERLAEARRFEVRAHDHLHIVERKAEAAHEHAAELGSRGDAARLEAAELERRSRELAEILRNRPRLTEDAVAEPAAGPAGVAEWGTRVRAALLVARSQLAAEEDAVVRQAIELGTVLLGEEIPPVSAEAVAKRVARELGA